MRIPRVMIAAAASGSGKTTISCGLMSALRQKGLHIVSGKCGPDYIDPMFHREVLGIDSENLDLFFTHEEQMRRLFVRHAADADATVLEGVMGYYDGMGLDTERASSYDVAGVLECPVILVVPCRGMALSCAALVRGFLEFRRDSQIRGILLNRISPMLYPRMKQMLEAELGSAGFSVPVIGYVPEHEIFHLESRHLGLVTPEEIGNLKNRMDEAGRLLAETVDLEQLLEIASQAPELPDPESEEGGKIHKSGSWNKESRRKEDCQVEKGCKNEEVCIAVARDEAFNFYYKDNLKLLEELGCRLITFSPLRDQKLPDEADGLLLGGGYPELYARILSENREMCHSVAQAIRGGMPCHAECGGFLYLHEYLEDKEGIKWRMAGVIPGEASATDRLVRFGYVELEAKRDGAYLKKGERIRGHEFHYWDSSCNGADVLAVKPDGKRFWECIHMHENLFAGFPHLSYESNPEFARRFVDAARKHRET